MQKFEIIPQGPFQLAEEAEYFGGWPPLAADPAAVGMAFPVEGWRTSAAVILRQDATTRITGEVHGAEGDDAAAAWRQALAVVSLDADGQGWPEIGRRDPVIGRLQAQYNCVRPVCFHTPYEAAAHFVIGQRISVQQARTIRLAMARAVGDPIQVGDEQLYAFPRPQVLAELTSFPGLSEEKVHRLQGLARAALDGVLDRERLRAVPPAQALSELLALRGVGPFSAQGILFRGAGLVDDVTEDENTNRAVQLAYQLPAPADHGTVLRLAENWRPYRMWAVVLLHIWLRREGGGAVSATAHRRPPRAARSNP
ncbi:MAG TPA: DNA-3-methyladenine glycosylase 2 family protein [Chloroflexia bacterium]|nr:DNA-3-methyladenine glycosylase 2 family protein [Chloroflexia bacterium]